MLNCPLYLALTYFGTAIVFSLIYYAAWRTKSDVFIVHQEMNLRPLSFWKTLTKKRQNAKITTPDLPKKTIEDVFNELAELDMQESELQSELNKTTADLENKSKEVKRL